MQTRSNNGCLFSDMRTAPREVLHMGYAPPFGLRCKQLAVSDSVDIMEEHQGRKGTGHAKCISEWLPCRKQKHQLRSQNNYEVQMTEIIEILKNSRFGLNLWRMYGARSLTPIKAGRHPGPQRGQGVRGPAP